MKYVVIWMSSIVDVTPDPVIKTESLYLFISQSLQDTRFRLYTGKKFKLIYLVSFALFLFQ